MSCSPMKISLTPKSVVAKTFKTNGYYYGQSDSEKHMDIFFFYNNGTMLFWSNQFSENFDTEIVDRKLEARENGNEMQNNRTGWGIFQIQDSNLEFEFWDAKELRPTRYKTKYYNAKILNDSTFEVSTIYNNYLKEEYMVNSKFHFHPFAEKIDSINNFIKPR